MTESEKFGSFKKQGEPNIDPKILQSLLWAPQKGTSNVGKPPFRLKGCLYEDQGSEGLLPRYAKRLGRKEAGRRFANEALHCFNET